MPPPSGPRKSSKTSTDSAANLFIFSFIKARKDLQLYPAGNAAVAESLNKMLQALQSAYADEEVVELLVEKDRLFVNGLEPGKNEPRLKEMALSFFRRGVRKILLDPSIPLEEMKVLLGVLNLSKERIAEAGGVEKLTKSRNIIHAVVEETAELMILEGDGLSLPDRITGEIEDETIETPDENPEALGHMFVRMQAGDRESLRRLQVLLKKPTEFSRILEKFALQLRKVENEFDPASQVDRLLKTLQTINIAVGHVPSQEERAELLQNVAMSVLNMSANIRTELINQGLVPNLALKSIESDILSFFPVSQLADVLLENFEISGATSSIMQSYFNNLKLSQAGKNELAQGLREGLTESGLLDAELEALLSAQAGPADTAAPDREVVFPRQASARMELYPPERVLFLEDERSRLRSSAAGEMSAPAAADMAPILLELMRHESVPLHYPPLVAKAQAYLQEFLNKKDYDKAADFLEGLREELERKKQAFTQSQIEPLRSLLDQYCGNDKIQQMAGILRSIHAEGPEFERLVKYFSVIGTPAISALMRLLENELSRHARLLICKAVARSGEKNIIAIAEKLKHPQWYVVRNAVSILGQTGSSACVPYLRPILGHEDARVRKEVLRALATIRSGEAVELLCSAIEDEDAAICKAAIGWAAVLEAEQALPALRNLLESGDIMRKDEELLRLAIQALRAIGSTAAVQLLEKLTSTRSIFHRRKAASLRDLAGAALDELGDDHE